MVCGHGNLRQLGGSQEYSCYDARLEMGKYKMVAACSLAQAGFTPTAAIMLTRDIGMKKKGFSEDIGGELKGVMEYISDDDVKKAKELIVKAIMES